MCGACWRNWRKLARPAINQAADDCDVRGRRRILTSSSVKRTLLALTVRCARLLERPEFVVHQWHALSTTISSSSVLKESVFNNDLKLKCLEGRRAQQRSQAQVSSRKACSTTISGSSVLKESVLNNDVKLKCLEGRRAQQRCQAQVSSRKACTTTDGRESVESSWAFAGATGQILGTRGRVDN